MDMKQVLKKNTMVIALLLVALFFTWQTSGALLSAQNITNLIAQNSYVVILAVGMLLCILTGGNIDLSVGSIVCLIGAIAGKMIVEFKMNLVVAIVFCILTGLLIGSWQAFWIAYVRIPPFIVTLAGMLLWRGVALLVLKGLTISPFPDNYLVLFNSYIGAPQLALIMGIVITILFVAFKVFSRQTKKKKGYEQENLAVEISRTAIISIVIIALGYKLSLYKGIPIILVLLAIIVALYSYYTSKTVPGRYYYAIGGNEKAAKLSGINTNKVYFKAYLNMAFLSAVAALVCVARFNSSAPTAGTNYEMDAIAACFIGGASAYGGIGTVPGVVIGAIFMGVLNNGMSIMGIDANWQKAVKGLVLLAAVVFDVMSKKKDK
ncbi:multiple monosaccharide ABC transporter permease [Cellulosilyticum ruminicola]|uniref:multiple monosaccharide ABC transporter permease n=1 Tax=Cellulosilyticum ruminicola TaxID=425254 RepID=UPI0006D29C8B|nr:multiple monosaccharide ABC transporter permease [Cellulosilyticum ruminicola]